MHVPCWPKLFIAAVLLVVTGCAMPRGDAPVEGSTISKVSIRHVGPKSIEEDRLRTHIRTTAGSHYRSERIDDDIKALYESGLVNDVQVRAEPRRRGVEVTFEVQTRGRMGPPLFAGNTVFSDQGLAKETGLRSGQKIDAPELLFASRRIEAFYQANGYPGTKVSVRTQPAAENGLDFIFIVEERQHSE